MVVPRFRKKLSQLGFGLAVFLLLGIITAPPAMVFAGTQCGGDDSATHTSIDIGCTGKGNSITDLTFAIIRFLSNGVGIVVVGSMIVAGIKYTSSRGDPGETAKAIARIRANVFALLIYIFAYAILNFLIPGGFLK